MITSFELTKLVLNGDLENEKFLILEADDEREFETALRDATCFCAQEEPRLLIGSIPYSGELGYLVQLDKEASNRILGPADALYEITGTDVDSLYTVWAIHRD